MSNILTIPGLMLRYVALTNIGLILRYVGGVYWDVLGTYTEMCRGLILICVGDL